MSNRLDAESSMNSSGLRASTAALIEVTVIAVLAGCAPKAENRSAGGSPTESLSLATAQTVSLRVTDAAGLREVLAKHRGKVVLVDYWATWCGPCVEQFPHTVELAGKFGERGLAVVSVSIDNPSAEPQVRAFLEQQEARFDNLLSSYGSPVGATKAFDLPGPVPCYRVYDRAGKLHREFAVDPRAERQFTTADIDAAIAEVL
jgi:thiol-disulfide isomerase/thioredoxin